MSIVTTMLAASAAAGIICSGNAQTDLGNIQAQAISNNNKNVIIQQGNSANTSDLNAFLEKNGITLRPDCNKPGSAKPNPDCNKPGSIKPNPDCNKPGVDKPTPDKPGTDKPNPDKPGTDKPNPDKPGTDTPAPDKPGNGETAESSYATRVVELVNAERTKNGLKPLTIDKNTAKAADVRAREIKQSFSHTRPDGSSFTTVLKENGVSYKRAGENIAWGQRTPEEVVKGWMNSEGHRANILNESFTSIGVGYYVENGTAYWTQLFIA